tara:strand:+ start:584 stop:895 length:312 start_codon:yes stop_codon:yes gene_type:complete
MSIIKPKFVEIEIQEQTNPDRATNWMTIVKFQPEVKEGVMDGALEIKTILMTDYDPVVRWTRDLGDKVVDVPENAEAALKANRIEADRREKIVIHHDEVIRND